MTRQEYKSKYGLLPQLRAFLADAQCFFTHRNQWEYFKTGSSYTGYDWDTICRGCNPNWKRHVEVRRAR